ncbi:hypothetical protein K443DRAFT_371092 [Laccaria amethystina LaAM-08-1]|uniref:Uncharacterized protein n=1 Tax=Laccaria amethystina LaAM-08-1 TaxID=1095629 RepID=A0A0C9WYP2_9AGAR|nr:hypothetical protein K443DRAFT_371092 [Laccaria amethystina LaAM-08-1]
MGAPMAHTPFTVADVISTWLAEGSDPDIVKGRLEFERDRLAAAEKRRAGMDNPSSLMVYNVLGGDEQEYARALKTDLVNARPELPEWNNERTKVREAMHKTKFDALEYARTQEVVKWGNHKEQRWPWYTFKITKWTSNHAFHSRQTCPRPPRVQDRRGGAGRVGKHG